MLWWWGEAKWNVRGSKLLLKQRGWSGGGRGLGGEVSLSECLLTLAASYLVAFINIYAQDVRL